MKIRTDFVTNSSSSSFIIAYKEFDELNSEITEKYPMLKNYHKIFDNFIKAKYGDYYDEDNKIISTIEELDEWFEEEHCYDYIPDDYINNNIYYHTPEPLSLEGILKYPEAKEKYDKFKNYIDNNYKIIIKRIPYSRDDVSEILRDLDETNENFVIIKDTEY